MRREVLRTALLVTSIGAVVGLASALAGGRMVKAVLFDVHPADPLTLSVACAVLMLVAFGAGYFPARQATRIDPASALRSN